ncbi:MAG TPA: CmcJ/NvfI family oxidoreductase [Bradyrhizobium sp.]|nr:CmcJ/NvfI family oxidoreductase [Bradyrhizobium sp.]
MGLQETKIESLPFVKAELNYLAPVAGKPRTYAFDPPPGEPKSTALPEPHVVPIFDGRLIARNFSLDREGFQLVRHPTVVRNFYDDEEVKRVYYPAVEAFLKATLKADRVVIFDHTVRKRVEGAPDLRGAGPRQPATRVHVDQTVTSGANRVREHVPDEAEELLKGRVQVINLWRPIRGPLRDSPLAMLDGSSVKESDLVPSDLIYPNRRGETYSVTYSPDHRWFYFPEMTPDEAILLKCYDSATDGRTRFGPHTAFVDPTTPADAPPRESIELRTLVFHKPGTT